MAVLCWGSMALAHTLDTGHDLYSHMLGVYVFDNRADDGDNIAGTGTMVGTTEGATGFATPITQSFQSWHNSFGSAYTVCLWHDGVTLDAWQSVLYIGDSTLAWQRYSTNAYFKLNHNGTGYTVATLTTTEVASEMMLSLAWDTVADTARAYSDGTEIASAAAGASPKTDSTTSAIGIGGHCTVTRAYLFDALLSTEQLAALAADPGSIFTAEAEVDARPHRPVGIRSRYAGGGLRSRYP